jgi:hypothetical protein
MALINLKEIQKLLVKYFFLQFLNSQQRRVEVVSKGHNLYQIEKSDPDPEQYQSEKSNQIKICLF